MYVVGRPGAECFGKWHELSLSKTLHRTSAEVHAQQRFRRGMVVKSMSELAVMWKNMITQITTSTLQGCCLGNCRLPSATESRTVGAFQAPFNSKVQLDSKDASYIITPVTAVVFITFFSAAL